MRILLQFLSIFFFSYASTILALPITDEELFENLIESQTVDPLADISVKWWMQINPFLKISVENVIEASNIESLQSSKTDKQTPLDMQDKEVTSGEHLLREMLMYYIALVESDTQSISYKIESTESDKKNPQPNSHPTTHLIPIFAHEFNELLQAYSIRIEPFISIGNLFRGDIFFPDIQNGETVSMDLKLSPILFNQYRLIDTSLSFMPRNTLVGAKQGFSYVKVLTLQELIDKIINIIKHPITIVIALVFLLIILPIFLLTRRARYTSRL